MPSPEKDRLAAEAMQCWVDFQEGLSSEKRKYPVQQFRAFWEVTKRYAELTRSDPLIHRSVAGAVNGLLDFLEVENVSAFQVTFFEMLSAWSASFLTDMTRISRGMNYRACKERRPCVGTFVSFPQGCLRNPESCSKFRTKPRILRPPQIPRRIRLRCSRKKIIVSSQNFAKRYGPLLWFHFIRINRPENESVVGMTVQVRFAYRKSDLENA